MNLLAHLSAQEQHALQTFKESVVQLCGTNVVALTVFGSRARGAGHEDSDIDVLVVLDHLTDARKREVWALAYHLCLQTEIDISPLVLSREQFDGLRNRERRIALSTGCLLPSDTIHCRGSFQKWV